MAVSGDVVAGLAAKFAVMLPLLDERQRRVYLGSEARALGHGGIAAVARASGVSEATVSAGVAECEAGAEPSPGRSRRPGGGRKRAEERDPGLRAALEALLGASTRGDPVSPLLWTTLSLREIAAELGRQGHRCGKDAVAGALRSMGYSLRGNSRVVEGRQHPDRDAQFRAISDAAGEYLRAGSPVVSVDAKKKELVGDFWQAGRTWRPKGDPVRVRDHDFPDPALGTAAPYGIYDVAANDGFVNVGTDHDTAAFAVESLRRWWDQVGRDRYPGRRRLLVTCDAGGSNAVRNRAWKDGLARLAAGTGLAVTVMHFPPGTSKWNKAGHRLFCHITRSWRGRPLASCQVIIETIAAVTTAAGLTVTAVLDEGSYPEGVKVTRERMRYLEDHVIERHPGHGDWNYTIRPAPDGPEPGPDAGPGLAALAALAGISDLPALLDAARAPWDAARDHRLHLSRGRARKKASGPGPSRLPYQAVITAAACRVRLRATWHLLGRLLDADEPTIALAASRAIPILGQLGIATPAGQPRTTTLAQLGNLAAANGVDITPITQLKAQQVPNQDDTHKKAT